MKARDADILIIPGYQNSGENHWQSRWLDRLSTARRVEQKAWSKPVLEDWVSALSEAVHEATRPVVLVGHSLGASTAIHALPGLGDKVAGAFLVAPPDVSSPTIRPKHFQTFGPYPTEKLNCPSVVVASRNDPYSSYEASEANAEAWGSRLIDAGEAGHINAEAGFGPWPEGTLAFAHFIAKLG